MTMCPLYSSVTESRVLPPRPRVGDSVVPQSTESHRTVCHGDGGQLGAGCTNCCDFPIKQESSKLCIVKTERMSHLLCEMFDSFWRAILVLKDGGKIKVGGCGGESAEGVRLCLILQTPVGLCLPLCVKRLRPPSMPSQGTLVGDAARP